jgi:predicted nucleic-acid-binding Zn-ribbon protein
MKALGHKNIQNTLLSTQLITFKNNNFHLATVKTVEDTKKLIKVDLNTFATLAKQNCLESEVDPI